MAVMLEVRDRRGVASWHRLDGSRYTIGRALSNEVILDDPYADARHAVIDRADDGTFVLADLGSVNGTFVDGTRLAAPLSIRAGVELRVGRSSLRLRDDSEELPAAVAETAQRLPRGTAWALSGRGSVGVMAIVTAFAAWLGWASSTNRSPVADAIGAGLAGLLFTVIWAGIWGVATRGSDRRFRFRAHLFVIVAAFVLLAVSSIMSQWLEFYFPNLWLIDALFMVIMLAIVGGLVTAHLTVGGGMTPRGRLFAGIAVCAAFIAFALLGQLTTDEKFTDVPSFSSQLKPAPGGRVPAMSIDEFVAAMQETRAEADEAIAK